MKKIRKAVFPVAGMGTRFLPATKANPKEMLPIVDKPLIQYAVEEAVAAGIQELIFVTSYSKRAIEDHFDSNFELEQKLLKSGKLQLLEVVRNILPKGTTCAYVRQPEALGLGHAVRCAYPLVGDEPFAVLLADDLIDGGQRGCLKQLVEAYETTQQSVLAVQRIPRKDTHKYGVVSVTDEQMDFSSVNEVIEKPAADVAPSTLGVVGRYILTPGIFTALDLVTPGAGSEIQLTDAIQLLLKKEEVHSLAFEGKRYDCGSKLGYLEATIAYAMKHQELRDDFRSLLEKTLDTFELVT